VARLASRTISGRPRQTGSAKKGEKKKKRERKKGGGKKGKGIGEKRGEGKANPGEKMNILS